MLYFYSFYNRRADQEDLAVFRAESQSDADALAGTHLIPIGFDVSEMGKLPEEKIAPLLGAYTAPQTKLRGGNMDDRNVIAALRYAAEEYMDVEGVPSKSLFMAADAIERSLLQRIGAAG